MNKEIEDIKHSFEKLNQNDYLKEIKSNLNINNVFANSEIHLKDINVYGFDYDYTIANYTEKTMELSYYGGQKYLVESLHYPKSILTLKYRSGFAIRGLHFDTKTGYFLKLNQFSKIEQGSVYYGKKQVPQSKVEEIFPGRRVSDDYALKHMKMMADIFELALANLLVDIIQFFNDNKVEFNSSYLYTDVRNAIDGIHQNKLIHKKINSQISDYVKQSDKFVSFIRKLLAAKKKIFMLTNNSFDYVDLSCTRMFRDIVEETSFSHWSEIFDVVMMIAKKPLWYENDQTFRIWDKEKGCLTMKTVDNFVRGEIYYGGSFKEFERIAGWSMSKVLYMGDNVYNDLRRPRKFCNWRTVAIVNELDHEIEVMNRLDFKKLAVSLYMAEKLFRRIRALRMRNKGEEVRELEKTVLELKLMIHKKTRQKRAMFNRHFGSVFRTTNSATKFFYNVQRYADLYTSNVSNFDDFPLDTAFYVKTRIFAHEIDLSEQL